MNIYRGQYNYSIQTDSGEEGATKTLTEARKLALSLSKEIATPVYVTKMTDGEGDQDVAEYHNGRIIR